MTRMQNAQKQLSDALLALESAADHASEAASLPRTHDQANAHSDLSTLVDEVSIIEAKLSEAIALIAKIESAVTADGVTE